MDEIGERYYPRQGCSPKMNNQIYLIKREQWSMTTISQGMFDSGGYGNVGTKNVDLEAGEYLFMIANSLHTKVTASL